MIFITLLTIISSANAEIGASSDLNCNFAGACRWSNSSDPAAPGKFVLTTRVEESSIMAREESNPTPFAYTSGLMGRTLALLVSEVVNCQLGGANIKYWYYKTGRESQLDVCIRQPPGNRDIQAMRCYDGSSTNYVNQWVLRTIELPPIGQPFEIVFKAIFIPPMDALAIDEISYEAMLCEATSSGGTEGAGGTFDDVIQQESTTFAPEAHLVHRAAPTSGAVTRQGSSFAPLCPPVDCDFDDHTLCNYLTSSSNTTNLKKWRTSTTSVLNSLTGIPGSNGGVFLYAGGTTVSPDDVFILSSESPFRLRESSRVAFSVYQAGIRGQLRVCIDDDQNCPLLLEGSRIEQDAQKWKNHFVDVEPGEHVIHFIVDGLFDNYAIGLDNIQLLNRYGTSSASCETPTILNRKAKAKKFSYKI